ncbi:MAG: TIGR02147 family protein [Deltaproteobacteria bacterium]|nr:TIGR02147 family protein [Deltaproteobacteria bacterium]
MGRKPSKPKINIFLYSDFRSYLRDLVEALKSLRPEMTMRNLAKEIGFGSPSFVKMIIDGERKLSKTSIEKLCAYLNFKDREKKYLEYLVEFSNTSDPDKKNTLYNSIISLKPKLVFSELKKHQNKYLSNDYYACIREMVLLKDFKEDPKWIAAKCLPRITPAMAREAINTLLELGLLKRDEQQKLCQSDAVVDTGSHVEAMEAFGFHEAVLNKARRYLAHLKQQNRNFSALTIPIPAELEKVIAKKMQHLQDEILTMINQKNIQYDEVFQLNFQFFPVTRALEKKGTK